MLNPYQPSILLVTGGAGFIGANFIRHVLMHEPHLRIINLDKLTYAGSLANLNNLPSPSRHHFIQGDILDEPLVNHILREYHVDTIVHFAAESHVDRSIEAPRQFLETNVLGTHVLLEAARKQWLLTESRTEVNCRFHHISTDEVYGSLGWTDAPFSETTNYEPRSPYSASKASSDHLLYAYYHTYGLPVTLSNCSNNYGPFQHPEKFIPTIIRACLNQQAIPVYGKGKNIRDWLHVEDHCRGILQILKHGTVGEKYNLGGNNEWENLALVNYLCELMDNAFPIDQSYKHLIQFVSDRPGHDLRYAIDASKAKQKINWQPEQPFKTGLQKTIEFYATASATL